MDCIDCHNRAGTCFRVPERALDRALASGQISPTLPFVKREALAALKARLSGSGPRLCAKSNQGSMESWYSVRSPARESAGRRSASDLRKKRFPRNAG
jgi:hypothetical protein